MLFRKHAEEINLPRKRIGQLLVFSVIMAITWYVANHLRRVACFDSIGNCQFNFGDSGCDGKAFGGSQMMGNFFVLGGIGGILTSWIGFYVGGSRAIYALAKAGMLPKSLGELHPKYKTPHKAILLIAVLRLRLHYLVDLLSSGSSMRVGCLVVAWLMVALSFVILRKKRPAMKRPFLLRGGTTIGWIAILMSIGMSILYMPGMPSALIWPYEWVIIISVGPTWELSFIKYPCRSTEQRSRMHI